MRLQNYGQLRLVLMVLITLTVPASALAAPQYDITDLGALGWLSMAYGINDLGQVVGTSFLDHGGRNAFVWADGIMVDLGEIYLEIYGISSAFEINNSGQIIGDIFNPYSGRRGAFICDTINPLDYVSDTNTVRGINNSGQMTGQTTNGQAFLLDDDITTIIPGNNGVGLSINDHGQVAGGTNGLAFVYDESNGFVNLGTMEGDDGSDAQDINNYGQVVGSSSGLRDINGEGLKPYHTAFLYTENTGMIDISVPGSLSSHARAINDSGQIVGIADYKPFLWENGTTYYLENLIANNNGWILDGANDINNLGQIVGYGDINGRTHAYLLTPVPEPATISFLIVGVLLLKKHRKRL